MSKNSSVKQFIRLLKLKKLSFCSVIACSFISNILYILVPLISAIAIDNLLATKKVVGEYVLDKSIVMPIIFMLIFSTVAPFITALQEKLMARLSEEVVLETRTMLMQKFIKLPVQFFDSHQVGDILSRTTTDLNKISTALLSYFSQLFGSIITIILSGGMLLYYNFALSLIIIGLIILSAIFTYFVAERNKVLSEKTQEKLGDINTAAEEYFTGNTEIKAFNQENEIITKMENLHEEHSKLYLKAQFLNFAIFPIMRFLTQIAFIISALFGAKLALMGVISVGILQAYLQYVNYISAPITNIAYVVNGFQSAMGAFNRALELFNEEEEIHDKQDAKLIKNSKGNVEFKNVSFGYSKDNILMNNISFKVNSGEMVAIVGPTGAGKTTLINLLLRFYEINSGNIFIDGVSISELKKGDMRRNFGMVLQDTWLFKGTIAENIAYGKKDATREEIIEAAKKAQSHHFIETLPNGYDTIISNDETIISQGQKQLLTIARIFLIDPPIIILDEATSSIDTRTEIKIQEAINNVLKGRTSFVIAHRLSTITSANLILVINNGNIIEQGSHEQLLSKDSFYAGLYNSQFQN